MPTANALDPATLLRPHRPHLAAAREAVAGIADPREAWEVLAARDLIPLDWASDPRRAFAGRWHVRKGRGDADEVARSLRAAGHSVLSAKNARTRCEVHYQEWHAAPTSLPLAVALASDRDGVLVAEAMAREFAAGLARARRATERVGWLLLDAGATAQWREQLAREAGGGPDGAVRGARDLLATGYVVDAVFDGVIVLLAPALE